MIRFLLRRLPLVLYTLWVTSLLVFALTAILPSDVGRTVLGPFAAQATVDALNHELGADRPMLERYGSWLGGLAVGDWGRSVHFDTAVLPLVLERTQRSLTLAALALTLLVPLGIGLGVAAALVEGSLLDRLLSTLGLVLGAMPEFVTGTFLIVALGLWTDLLPIQALAPPGASLGTQLLHLVMPALCLVLLLFSYLFRVTRVSTIAVWNADATRTAILKGLHPALVVWRHVLPAALPPTLTVIGAQLGWIVGGLVVVESLFRYPGLGSLVFFAASHRDLPLLVGCTMMAAFAYTLGNLAADLAHLALDPRLRRAR